MACCLLLPLCVDVDIRKEQKRPSSENLYNRGVRGSVLNREAEKWVMWHVHSMGTSSLHGDQHRVVELTGQNAVSVAI